MTKEMSLGRTEVYPIIREKWKLIEDRIDDGSFQYELTITEIDSILNRRRIYLMKHPNMRGRLSKDFRSSRDMHIARKLWYNKRRLSHETQIIWWKENVKQLNLIAEKVGMSGLAVLFTIHGAIAIGSMKLITEGKNELHLLLMSRIGLFFSILGISTLIIGKAMLFHSISKNAGDLDSSLVTVVNQDKLREMYELNSSNVKSSRFALYVIYSSAAFLAICLIMILLVSLSVQ